MGRAKHKRPGPGKPRAPTDWGKRIAQLLCLTFALVGVIPLSGGLLIRSEPIKRWAAFESSRLLRDHLGLSATFQVELSLIPVRLQLLELKVRDRSREEPAIYAQSIVIAPRFFSLLAGRIDVGDIELENSSVRLVVRDGAVQNIALRLPERQAKDTALNRSPFRTLAVTNVNLDLQLDDQHAAVEGIDLDAIADRGLTFDVALRVAGAEFSSQRRLTATADPKGADAAQFAHDEDRLCSFEAHAQVSKTAIDIQRLAMVAAFDTEPGPDLGAQCDDLADHQLALRLAQFSVTELDQGVPQVRGNIMIKAPLMALNRALPSLRGEGWASFSGSAAFARGMRLPELSGRLSGERMKVNNYKIADELSAEVLLSKETVFVPRLMARWGNGSADLKQLRIEPFAAKMPLDIAHISTQGIDLPGVLREILMTDHSWVDWNFGETEIDRVRGTISPFFIDGGVEGRTKDFVIWDRGFNDPARNRMFGIPMAHVKGRFRASQQSLDFYNCDLRFGASFLPVDLVSIRFYPNELTVRIKPEGGDIELSDLGRIADVTLAGKSHVFADLKGPMSHPVLKGTVAVTDFSIAGFPAGDIDETQVHFEPLYLEMTDLRGNKGPMNYHLPKARLSFDGPASVEFTTQVISDKFSLAEFLNVFHFDEDERFADLVGNGKVTGNVRYLLGGPEDRCKGGRLLVQGQAQLTTAELLDEQFSGGQGDFSLDWFDINAGLLGLSLDIGALTLRKGTGTLYGSASVRHGGALTGDIIASKIPFSRLDLLPKTLSAVDGFVAGSAHLSGSLDALVIDSDVLVSELRMGQGVLPPSQLKLRLSRDPEPVRADARLTACGGRLPSPTPIKTAGREREGELLVNGQLFAGSIDIHDFKVVQQQDPVMTGQLTFQGFDLRQLDALSLAPGEPARVSSGSLTGKLVLDELLVNAPFSSRAELQIDSLTLVSSQVTFSLAQAPLIVRLGDQALSAPNLVLAARTKSGHTGVVDGNFTLRGPNELTGALRLRPTSLQVLAAATPLVERAEGELTAALDVTGTWAEPLVRGDINVQKGFVKLAGLTDAVEELNLHAALDKHGIHLDRGRAQFAGGNVDVKGELPLSDGSLGQLELGVVARGIHYKSPDQIQVTLDADLKLLALRQDGGDTSLLPSVSGTVDILSADYQKPMSLTADISTLTTRGDKTEISGYDAEKDHVELDLLLRGTRSLSVKNELVQANLRLDPAGLRVTGTDQRFGAVGTVEVQPGGRIFLRRNEFEVQTGLVRFNDPTRLRPEVDVSAITEYRRYNTVGGAPGQSNQNDSSTSTVGSGNWRISMHAYGPPENLKVDLTSDPPLGQDDIFLLLTVGLTRTELDQSRSSGVGSSVALEALGTLSGAESAVTDVVPVDEFRFGSTYSSRSGRTEPTVTIGKRLSDRIRASVTTSLSETSEIRSNVEYRATQNVSVEGSFDNARNVASAAGGNLGGDVRWRIEFR